MNNIKCPNCGFINFVTAECCRKCETPLSAAGSPEPVYSGQGAPFEAYPSPFQVTPAKSAGGIPILKICLCLFGGLILISVIAGAGVVFLKRSSTVLWREFQPLQGSYKVMMPTEPRAQEPIVTPLPTGNMTNHIYTSAVIGQGLVMYCVVTYPADLDMQKVNDAMVEEELSKILAGNKSTLVSKKSILFAGSRGLEFEFEPHSGNLNKKRSKGFGKLFFKQNHEYLFMITASEGSALLAGKDKFLTPIAYPLVY
jgi:hypothetical protein